MKTRKLISTTRRLALKSTAAPHTPATPATPTNPTSTTLTSPVLTTRQAAEYLNVKESTLEQQRWQGKGPRFVKLSRSVRYRLADLEAYLEERTFNSTTEAQAAA